MRGSVFGMGASMVLGGVLTALLSPYLLTQMVVYGSGALPEISTGGLVLDTFKGAMSIFVSLGEVVSFLGLVVAFVGMVVPRARPKGPLCPDCSRRIETDFDLCPHCGANLRPSAYKLGVYNR